MEEHLRQNESANKVLLKFGTNIYGKPLYRMVWSDSRLWYLAGEWRKKYSHLEAPMWVIEAWRPAEFYGDPIWWAAHDLGPYPHEGDYEFAQASPNDVFANLSDDQAQRVVTAIALSSALTIPQRLDLYKAEQEKKQKERERVIGDIVNDSKPAIHAKIPDHIERMERKPVSNPLGNRTGSYIISSGDKQ